MLPLQPAGPSLGGGTGRGLNGLDTEQYIWQRRHGRSGAWFLCLFLLNKALGIQLPLWVTGGWMAVIAGLAIAVMVLKNRG